MSTIDDVTHVVRRQGATIRKDGERLVVTHDDKVIDQIQLHNLGRVVLTTDVQITSQAVAHLLKAGVPMFYMTRTGRMLGRLSGDDSKFAELRLRQLETVQDAGRSLSIARQIIAGKVANQLVLLERFAGASRALPAAPSAQSPTPAPLPAPRGARTAVTEHRAYGAATRGMREMLAQAINALDADTLRGFEGRGAAWYWPVYRLLLTDAMGFKNREYHPPPDPINALLSFCYALLQRDVHSAVLEVGLDPHLGFFHTVQYGRPSLALDLMEEFRPVLADAVVLRLVNTGQIKARDFVTAKDAGRPISLSDDAIKRVIEAYETRAASDVPYRYTGERTSLRRCIELQVRQVARVLRGLARDYEPFLIEP
jgi:CRISP-associated protein Cas1